MPSFCDNKQFYYGVHKVSMGDVTIHRRLTCVGLMLGHSLRR